MQTSWVPPLRGSCDLFHMPLRVRIDRRGREASTEALRNAATAVAAFCLIFLFCPAMPTGEENGLIPALRLNDQQLAFVRHREGPAALLAVPGSGKTTTMVCRTAALIQSGVPARRILTMTFTKAAALDMTRRYAQLYGMEVGNGSDAMPAMAADPHAGYPMTSAPMAPDELIHAGELARFSTIHSFALQVIRHYCRRRNRPLPVILTESGGVNGQPTRLGLLTQLFRELVGGRIGEDTLEALSMGISLAKNTMQSPEAAAASLERGIKGFGLIFEAYERYKKERRLVDFDDMLSLCHRILTMDQGMLVETRNAYDYIQVDEAQDSSLIQHAIIDLIAQPRNNLALIGDEDQSIYVWRGAHPSGLLGFADRYPDARIFLMETNYRSRASIVRLADHFIRSNTERTEKHLQWGAGADPTPVQGIRIVRVKSLTHQYQQVFEALIATKNHSTPGKTMSPGNAADSNKAVDSNKAEAPQKTSAEKAIRSPKTSEIAKGSSAILYRNNRSVYGLADMLDHAGIPFRLRDFKDTLFQHWITRDITAFVRVMLDPTDREAFFSVAGRMNAYLSRDQLERLQALPTISGAGVSGSGNLFRMLRKDPGVQVFQRKRLEEVEQRFRRLRELKPRDAIVAMMDCVSYGNTLAFAARTQGYTPEYLESMVDILLVIAQNQTSLAGFLDRLDSLRGVLEMAKSAERRHSRVTLSTVHSAKGLEFDRVLLVDMVEGEFPSSDTEPTGAAIEEERRLCYVAITRARQELQVFVPAKCGRQEAEPSRFIHEMERAMRAGRDSA